MATTATLTDGFEYEDVPQSATLEDGWIYGGDFIVGGFEYVNRRPKVFTYLIPDD